VVTLWDKTVQHSGWSTSSFATGGWNDFFANTLPGLRPGSLWVSPLNGQATDVGVGYTDSPATGADVLWFNQHINSARQLTLSAAQPPLTASQGLYVYTRVPQSNQQILVRVVVSDQVVTPAPDVPPCAYGTRPKTTSPGSAILTPDLLQLILAPLNMVWAAILFVPLQFTVLNVSRLCSVPPPPLPIIDTSSIGSALGSTQQALDAVSWPYFCECIPGSPAPVPYPPPSQTQPPSWPANPTFPCDPADLCATLSTLRADVAGVRATLASVLELTTLLQRYGMPFAYAPGAVHTGLTGEGEFAVPRIVGVHVRVTSPAPTRVLEGNPDYWWDQGWMSIGNESGMLTERRVARQDDVWLPPNAQAATRFRYAFNAGVVADVRELYAEK